MKNALLILSFPALLSCGGSRAPVVAPTPEAEPGPFAALEATVSATLNTEISPCDDFYEYACGGWFATYELPDDKTRYTRSFGLISDNNLEIQRDLLVDYADNPGDDLARQQLGAYWKSCMDTDAIDAAGFTPLQATFDRIDEVEKHADLMPLIGELTLAGLDMFFSTYVDADDKNPEMSILIMTQGGTALPDRSFYLDDDESRATIRDKYQAHIGNMFSFSGASDEESAKAAEAVIAIETGLAEIHKERHELRDPTQTYHKIDKVGLQELTPNMNWDDYFEAMGKPDITQINVRVPDGYAAVDGLIASTDIDAAKAYLKWVALHDAAPHLAKNISDENFDFFARTLYGSKAERPRWKKCVQRIDRHMGELLGEAYVEVAFSGEAKPIALSMIHDIEGAFSKGLSDLAWMDETTAERAVTKMGKIRNKIGYPDKWKDYSGLTFGDSYYDNYRTGLGFLVTEILDRIEQPVDKERWYMSPQTVNAYYNPSVNEIVFPAGIMQAPFYDASYPSAFNYGAIGMVMGHELTHGFDDSGSKFDGDGLLTDWWEPDVVARFETAGSSESEQ